MVWYKVGFPGFSVGDGNVKKNNNSFASFSPTTALGLEFKSGLGLGLGLRLGLQITKIRKNLSSIITSRALGIFTIVSGLLTKPDTIVKISNTLEVAKIS